MGGCVLAGCAQPVASDPDATNEAVKPRVVTVALPHDTDDPAIWINRADPAKSLGRVFKIQGTMVRAI